MMVADMAKLYVRDRKGAPRPPEIPRIDTKIVVCVDSINQREALQPIIDHFGSQITLIGSNPDLVPHMPAISALKSLSRPYALHRLIWNYTLGPYRKEVYRRRFYEYHGHLGAYRFWREAFKKGKAKYFIAANDHSGLCPIAFAAAKNAGLQTIYVMHSTVSDLFPPLRVDHALLDGQDAKRKYLGAGPTKAEIHLAGTMKFDKHLRSPRVDVPGDFVGVCLGWNKLTDIPANIALCEMLEGNRVPFALRFHPAVNGDVRKLFIERGWTVSNPEEENPLDFILRCHTVVSSDSNILLEALVLKRRPVNFASDGRLHDYYGFVKSGLVDGVYYSPEEVVSALSQPFDMDKHRAVARWYCDTLNTAEEGHSTERALKILNDIVV